MESFPFQHDVVRVDHVCYTGLCNLRSMILKASLIVSPGNDIISGDISLLLCDSVLDPGVDYLKEWCLRCFLPRST